MVMRSMRSALPRRNIQKPAAATRTITTAVRTARFVFIQSPSLPSFLDRGACFPLGLAALDGLALVVRLLALREADRDLDAAVLQVDAHRDERHPLLDGLADQFPDLRPVQQQLPLAQGLVIAVAAIAVRADVDVVDPDFARFDARIAVAQVR